MSTQLENNLRDILNEKTTKIIPENIKDGVEIFDVTGTYKPTPNIYTQTTEPTGKEGIWLKTNNTFDKIEFTDNVVAGEEWDTAKMNNLQAIPYNFYQGSAVAIGTDVYLMGGNESQTLAYKYNITTDTYTQLTDIPYNFYYGSAVAIGTDVYLMGGNESQTLAYKYNTTTDTYTQLTNIPYNFYQGSAVAIGTDVYLMGGNLSSRKAYKYNITTDTYTQLTDIPYGFINSRAEAMGTDIYLLGSNEGNEWQTAYKYNITTDTYTQLTNIPYRFYAGTTVAISTDIYLFGGGYNYLVGNNAYKYDTLTDTYTQLDNIPFKFYAGSTISSGNEIYLFGGPDYPTKVQVLDIITVDFDDNSIIVQNGTGYKTQLYTNSNIVGRVLNYFNNVYYYTTANGLQELPTYYGNGTNWLPLHPVTGVSLSESTLSLTRGDTQQLTANITPSNATNTNVTWSTSDDTIATVDDGLVTAIAEGSATITVTTTDGSYTDTCEITVSSSIPTGFTEYTPTTYNNAPYITFYDSIGVNSAQFKMGLSLGTSGTYNNFDIRCDDSDIRYIGENDITEGYPYIALVFLDEDLNVIDYRANGTYINYNVPSNTNLSIVIQVNGDLDFDTGNWYCTGFFFRMGASGGTSGTEDTKFNSIKYVKVVTDSSEIY